MRPVALQEPKPREPWILVGTQEPLTAPTAVNAGALEPLRGELRRGGRGVRLGGGVFHAERLLQSGIRGVTYSGGEGDVI